MNEQVCIHTPLLEKSPGHRPGSASLLFDQESYQLYSLNETGRFIWQRYNAGISIETIAREMTGQYNVSFQVALQDVQIFLQSWQQGGIQNNKCSAAPLRPGRQAPKLADRTRLQGRDWVAKTCITLPCGTVEVWCGDELTADAVLPLLSHLQGRNSNNVAVYVKIFREKNYFHLYVGDDNYCRLPNIDDTLAWLHYELVELSCRFIPVMGVLHASAVSFENEAIIFAGECGAGKSTLVAGLQHLGFSYLSDDVCPLEPGSGQLIPVPLCQAIKSGSWKFLASRRSDFTNIPVYSRFNQQVRYIPPIKINRVETGRPWPVRALVFSHYTAQGKARLEPLPYEESLRLLIGSGAVSGDNSVWDLTDWLNTIPAYRFEYTNLNKAAEALRSISGSVET